MTPPNRRVGVEHRPGPLARHAPNAPRISWRVDAVSACRIGDLGCAIAFPARSIRVSPAHARVIVARAGCDVVDRRPATGRDTVAPGDRRGSAVVSVAVAAHLRGWRRPVFSAPGDDEARLLAAAVAVVPAALAVFPEWR